jgi:predicted enzyme related to lactoylglutathione lyase
MSGELGFFELGVEDADRARTFYGALFGWTFTPGPSGGAGSMIRTPNVPGGLHGGDPGAPPYLFFRVDDLEAAAARVRELGGTEEGLQEEAGADAAALESEYGRFTLCRDDQGSPFGLYQAPAARAAVERADGAGAGGHADADPAGEGGPA